MKRILIIEPELHGHKAFYLSLILKAFQGHAITVLTQAEHTALEEHLQQQQLSDDSFERIPVASRQVAAVFDQASQLSHQRTFDLIFISYLDHYLEAMLRNPQALRGPVSGIWFHPYALDRIYRWMPPLDKRSKLRGTLHRRLQRPAAAAQFEHIYFLDPEAPRRLQAINPGIHATVLPDPGEREPKLPKTDARSYFKLPQDKTIYLHAGSPEKRKGLPDVLRAFEQLCRKPEQRQRLFLLRIGPNERLNPKDQARLQQLIQLGCAQTTDGFVSNQDFIEYFAAADWILIPYRNFRFSSGILANARIAQRPVIASDYGMIGAQVRRQQLGLCFRMGSIRDLTDRLHKTWINKNHFSTDTCYNFINKIEILLK